MSAAVDSPTAARRTGSVSGVRYRCNLGLWVVAALSFSPFAVIHLLGPAFIAVGDAFAG